jgi:hypothetical protein
LNHHFGAAEKNVKLPIQTAQYDVSTTESTTIMEVTSLEQEGVLMVNVSSSNILTSDTILSIKTLKAPPVSEDLEEKIGKIQSNSREITGDANKNLHKAKETMVAKAQEERSTSRVQTDAENSSERNHFKVNNEQNHGRKSEEKRRRRRRHGRKR